LLPLIVASTIEANPTRGSSPRLLLLPHCNCSYASKDQIDQGQLLPLCLFGNWHQQPCS
jgi:hypothetical protein